MYYIDGCMTDTATVNALFILDMQVLFFTHMLFKNYLNMIQEMVILLGARARAEKKIQILNILFFFLRIQ